jgi:glucose/arabinose dehydrogenase
MVEPRDGTNRIFIAQQRGLIYVFDRNSNVASRKVFLDLSTKVSQSGGETGLLGLAFHPNFTANGYFYVNYTSSASGKLQSFVSRFQLSPSNPDSALEESELGLLTIDQPFENHNGGNVRFGPDGCLYLTFGDGGSGGDPQNNAQNRGTLLGKILRIDVNGSSNGKNYAIPPGNPYFGNNRGMREEIYAYGLRNPWKISFDRKTGTLWAGDVGQVLWEEIDTISVGRNYGWRIMEGKSCYNPSSGCDTSGLTLPLWVYYHDQGNISVTGGYVYRGNALPALQGKYVYGDYGSGNIWALTIDANGAPVSQLLFNSPYLISSFGEDQAGELYVVSYGNGRVYKLQELGTTVVSSSPLVPGHVSLKQNYPNPFNPSTIIVYQTSQRAFVNLRILNILGQEIQTLVDANQESGEHQATWDAHDVPSGVYFCQLRTGTFAETLSMLLLR